MRPKLECCEYNYYSTRESLRNYEFSLKRLLIKSAIQIQPYSET